MHQLREVLRLHGEGHGTKYISRATGVARNTVKKYLLHFVALRLPLRDVEKQSDSELPAYISIIPPLDRDDHRADEATGRGAAGTGSVL